MEKRCMVSLIKVHKTEEYIEGYYTCKGCKKEGYIRLRLSDGKELKRKPIGNDNEMLGDYIVVKHRLKIIRYMNIDDIPEETIIMW